MGRRIGISPELGRKICGKSQILFIYRNCAELEGEESGGALRQPAGSWLEARSSRTSL
jgi:hypothetical protein